MIEEALHCAHEYGHNFVGTEHLLYGLCSQENTAATVILENMKINPKDIKEQIIQVFKRNQGANPTQGPQAQSQMMNPLEFFLSGLHGVWSVLKKNIKMLINTNTDKNRNQKLLRSTILLLIWCKNAEKDGLILLLVDKKRSNA